MDFNNIYLGWWIDGLIDKAKKKKPNKQTNKQKQKIANIKTKKTKRKQQKFLKVFISLQRCQRFLRLNDAKLQLS
jgi:hypothetical protein